MRDIPMGGFAFSLEWPGTATKEKLLEASEGFGRPVWMGLRGIVQEVALLDLARMDFRSSLTKSRPRTAGGGGWAQFRP